MEAVKVVIPIYKNVLSELEKRSLRQVYTVLCAYPLVVVKPVSLDLSELVTEFPRLRIESFDDIYFAGISGYNRLMLSEHFYERFLDSEYILIYQLDAYVFRDELSEWVAKGYDYIGAPWLRKPIYTWPLISTFMRLCHRYARWKHRPSKQDLYDKIGNGGLSLRKVSSHLRVVSMRSELIERYLAIRHHLYNEDVFWATQAQGFRYPPVREALLFAFDKYPAYCFRLTGHRLPFGCHAWYKRKMRAFWKPIIHF